MVFVKKKPGQSDDVLIRQFSREVMREGIMYEMKKREYYRKPSQDKKYKKALSRKLAKFS